MSELDNPLLGYSGVDLDALNDAFGTGGLAGSMQEEYMNNHLLNPDSLMWGGNFRGTGYDNTADVGYFITTYVGEDGHRYKSESVWNPDTEQMDVTYTDERVYFFTPPDEHKRTHREDDVRQAAMDKEYAPSSAAGYYTEAEIRDYFTSGKDMQRMREAGVTWDKYWAYVTGVNDLIDSGELSSGQATSVEELRENFNNPPPAWTENEAYQELLDGLGIETQITNNGDVYNFNGFGYSRDYFAEKSDVTAESLTAVGLGLVGAFVAGPLLTNALTAGMGLSSAAASATSKAIISAATQLAANGEISWEQALLQAAGAYGAEAIGSVEGILGELGDKVTSVTDKFNDLIKTGNSIADAAIKAGGMDLLTQLVTTGEVDLGQAATAALLAGGVQGFTEWQESMSAAGIAEDEYMQDLAEYEEFQQAAIDADIKDPFLNPNYETVGDGLVVNVNTGDVWGYGSDESLGNISDLDTDGDGMLTGSDLNDITTDNEYVDVGGENIGTDDPGNPFRFDSEGNLIAEGSDYFREEGRYYVTEDGVIYNTKDLTYVDGGPNGTMLVKDANGNTFYVSDARYSAATGSFYDPESGATIGVRGAYDPASGNVYDAESAGLEVNPIVDGAAGTEELTYGRNPNWSDDPNYRGTVYGGGGAFGVNGEMDIFYDPTTNTYYTDDGSGNTAIVNVEDLPSDIQDAIAGGPDNASDASGQGSGGGDTSSTGGTGDAGAVGGSGTEGAGDVTGTGPDGSGSTGGSAGSTDTGVGGDTGAGTGTESSGEVTGSGSISSIIDAIYGGGSGGTTSTGPDTGYGGTWGGGADDGTASGGDGGTSGGSTDGSGTGGEGGGNTGGAGEGTGTSGGGGTGTGTEGGGTGGSTGDGTGAGGGTGEGTGDGGGTDGGSGGGSGGNTGGGTGVTVGPTFGTAPGPGGPGAGGGGMGTGGGMMSGGGDYRPEWGELFAYTTLTPYQKKALEPYRDYIKPAKGMLS